MSYSQLIRDIKGHFDEEGLKLFKELLKTTGKIQPDFAAGALQLALEEGDLDIAPFLIDELEESLKQHYVSQPPEVNVHKKDMLRWFEFMRHFVGIGRLDGANDIMWFYGHMFNRNGKTRCGSIRSRCSQANDGTCIYKFQKDEYVCPKCGTARSLCRRRPGSNGRCIRAGRSRGHGGDKSLGAMSPTFIDGRGQLSRRNIFARQLENQPKLHRMFVEAMQDPNYLSLEPEIALIAARRGELLADLDELDPVAIEAGVKSAVKSMRKAITKDKYESVIFHAQEIEGLLEGGRDNRARWREMNMLAGQMARLADAERKRIVEARKMVTVEEMVMLKNETVKAIRTAVIDGAEIIYRDFMKAVDAGTLHKMSADYIRQAMLRHISNRLRPLEEAERAEFIEMVDQQDEEE